MLDAARKAVDAAAGYGIAVTREALKKRSHRKPSDEKVQSYFAARFLNGDFVEVAGKITLKLMRDRESYLGKPNREWTLEERLEAYEFVAKYFDSFGDSYPRRRGRQHRHHGSLASRMEIGGTAARKQKTEELVNKFFRFEHPTKLGSFARKAKKDFLKEGYSEADADDRVGSPSAFRTYMEEADIDQDEIKNQRLSYRSWRRFLDREGVDPDKVQALRQRISRKRKLRP